MDILPENARIGARAPWMTPPQTTVRTEHDARMRDKGSQIPLLHRCHDDRFARRFLPVGLLDDLLNHADRVLTRLCGQFGDRFPRPGRVRFVGSQQDILRTANFGESLLPQCTVVPLSGWDEDDY